MTREEKKRAEDKIRELEEEHRFQQESVKRELERRAQVINSLRLQIGDVNWETGHDKKKIRYSFNYCIPFQQC